MQWIELTGYLGALLTLTTFSMKTMLRLRMVGIVANLAFITYGALGPFYPVLLLHLTLLPLNIWRLQQLRRLSRQISVASAGAQSMDWLKPFSRCRQLQAGQTLFHQGDEADELMFVLSGKLRAVQAGVLLASGDVIGELGLISKARTRTQTIVCEQDAVLLLISYTEARQMYFQNPSFGFYFLELAAERLMRDAGQGPEAATSVAAVDGELPALAPGAA